MEYNKGGERMVWIIRRGKKKNEGQKAEEIREIEEAREKNMLVKREKVISIAQLLSKAYDVLLEARRALKTAEEELLMVEILNLEKRLRGEEEEDLKPYQKKVRECEQRVREAERLVRLLESEAKRTDPQKFSFIP